MASEYVVTAVWDSRAAVYVGTCDDLPGLVVEARSLDELEAAARERVEALRSAYEELKGVAYPKLPVIVRSLAKPFPERTLAALA